MLERPVLEVHPAALVRAAVALTGAGRAVRDVESDLAGSIAFGGSATGDAGTADRWGSAWGAWSQALLDLAEAVTAVAESIEVALSRYEAADLFPGRR